MPFTVVDLSKLAELATLAGHSFDRGQGVGREFLGRLELAEDTGFDEERAKFDRLETAADDVVASCADKGGDGVREVPDEAPGAALQREEDSSVAERLAVGDGAGDVAAAETVEQASPAAAVQKVNGVAVFPDGRRVVSGSYDSAVKVTSVAVFPDGQRVISGSADKTAKLWG
ncbi:hypothetical protein SO694_0019608 [Aureococcus anophagefferens]|uniref:Pre-mRNA-processing factor 19 n=1 Tax=Aureococcus anophagefferens TaxID=44056 RepID=A0ABR1FNZ2_AURAN